jgi:predicted Zn-dependent protease
MGPVSERIARSAATSLPECRILASRQVNAFSLPGGLIYVTQGLYARIQSDEALLAAAIAHELAHIEHKDSLKPACGSEQESLHREIAADVSGAQYLREAGYSPEDLVRLLQSTADVQPAGWAEARVQQLQREVPRSSDKKPALAAVR